MLIPLGGPHVCFGPQISNVIVLGNSIIAYNGVLKSRVLNVSMFLRAVRVSHILFFTLVIWSTIAFNVTERLTNIHLFTAKRSGNLTAKLNLTSTAYHWRGLRSLQDEISSAQDQIRNLSYSNLSSKASHVTSAVPSCVGQCSRAQQQPVLTRREIGSTAFHKVRIC